MRPTELLATILLITSTSASVWDPIHGLQHDVAALLRRQNDASTSYDLSFSGTQGNTATTESSAESTATSDGDSTSTADKSDASSTGNADNTSSGDKSSGTAKETGTSTGKNSAKGTSTKTFDARLPAGGVSMITPNAQSTSYYKIKDYITFAWNYTSLSVTPSAVDILASCSLNQETYTIALNQSITGPTQHLTWDTGAFQASATVPLLTETYTLIIHDAAKDASATAQAGYLGTYNQFTFGMYSPQAYTPIADYVCATCNGALSLSERQTLWALFAMAGVTVLSFSWFTGVAGLW